MAIAGLDLLTKTTGRQPRSPHINKIAELTGVSHALSGTDRLILETESVLFIILAGGGWRVSSCLLCPAGSIQISV